MNDPAWAMPEAQVRARFTAICVNAGKSAAVRGEPMLATMRLPGGSAEPDFASMMLRAPRVFSWKSTWSGQAMTGFGTAIDLTARGTQRFERLQTDIRRLVCSGEEPTLVGGFSFYAGRAATTHWLPDALFWVPQALWQRDRDGTGSWLLSTLVGPHDDPGQAAMRALRWLPHTEAPKSDRGWEPASLTMDENRGKDAWHRLVEQALAAIGSGALDKVVPARVLPVTAPRPFHVPGILSHLSAHLAEGSVFAIGDAGRWFIGATPECLLARHGTEITTVGLAGSAPRGHDPASDAAFGDSLMTEEKIRREHRITADFLVDNIAHTCGVPRVDGPDLIRLPTVQHLRTRVQATVPPEGPGFLELVSRLHPTPAVGGMPSDRAVAWLANAEPFERGWFAGGVGWLRADDHGEMGLAIRSAEVSGSSALVYAGCGVVAGSSPRQEWRESTWKTRSMLSALTECVTAEPVLPAPRTSPSKHSVGASVLVDGGTDG